MADADDTFFREMVEHHISGQLKVAPEHIADPVLEKWASRNEVYERFIEKYWKINKQKGKNQFVVPYLMSSHPGSTLKEAVKLAEIAGTLGIILSRYRIFILHRRQCQRLCITPE